jgi:hypothetical protein
MFLLSKTLFDILIAPGAECWIKIIFASLDIPIKQVIICNSCLNVKFYEK